jgi:hypothetical protein
MQSIPSCHQGTGPVRIHGPSPRAFSCRAGLSSPWERNRPSSASHRTNLPARRPTRCVRRGRDTKVRVALALCRNAVPLRVFNAKAKVLFSHSAFGNHLLDSILSVAFCCGVARAAGLRGSSDGLDLSSAAVRTWTTVLLGAHGLKNIPSNSPFELVMLRKVEEDGAPMRSDRSTTIKFERVI